jgi:hypothetical protein
MQKIREAKETAKRELEAVGLKFKLFAIVRIIVEIICTYCRNYTCEGNGNVGGAGGGRKHIK